MRAARGKRRRRFKEEWRKGGKSEEVRGEVDVEPGD